MSMTDWFVSAWWLLLAAVAVPTVVLAYVTRQRREADLEKAALSYLNGSAGGRYTPSPGTGTKQTPWLIALLTALGLLGVGAFALFFVEYWTRLTLLSWQILAVVIGVGLAASGLSAKAFERVSSNEHGVHGPLLRIGCVLFGIAIAAYQGIAAVRDIAQPRRVVEGHVDSVAAYTWNESPSEYVVVIDGKRFYATFESFQHIQSNRPVRVEIGAGSGVILGVYGN